MADTALRLLPAHESFLADFFDLEKPLLIWLDQTTRDARDGADDVYELPASLDGEAAHEAWGRIFAALPEGLRDERRTLLTGEEHATGNTVLGTDGYEYTPLYAAPIEAADVEVLVALLDHFRKAVARESGYADLHSLLVHAGEQYGNEGADRVPETAEQVVNRLARVVAVLQLQDDDAQALLAAVTAAGLDRRIVLTEEQEQAARRHFDRVITAVTEGKPPVERALARFVEFGDTGRPATS
ncbi:hypothetical protein [Streptomyces rugosispiralis]|uniref:Uncharacterized protein n=1 Tax=Streptomyces rugosispiralis TaxID=2967341 RepID=A0ABT1VCX2_9ACTN|nr:hypothetical protein [Streptomyces rugosispiralis]MCQ8194624.1 hypothetical protein [Streptomyces rugosispiralis]